MELGIKTGIESKVVCCNGDMFTKGLLSPALSSSGGEGEETQAGHIYCVKL
jgi:hypothetical protein